MTESLREQQRRVAQDRIIEAAAEELVEVGLASLSVPAVAERAGVSLRTVYNHFESKDVLLESIVAASERLVGALGAIDVETDLERVPDAIRHNWPLFGQLGVIGQAAILVRLDNAAQIGQLGVPASNDRMTAALRKSLGELDGSLNDEQLQATMAVIRQLISLGSWSRVTTEFGVDSETAAEAAAWAFATLRDAIARGEGPFSEDQVRAAP